VILISEEVLEKIRSQIKEWEKVESALEKFPSDLWKVETWIWKETKDVTPLQDYLSYVKDSIKGMKEPFKSILTGKYEKRMEEVERRIREYSGKGMDKEGCRECFEWLEEIEFLICVCNFMQSERGFSKMGYELERKIEELQREGEKLLKQYEVIREQYIKVAKDTKLLPLDPRKLSRLSLSPSSLDEMISNLEFITILREEFKTTEEYLLLRALEVSPISNKLYEREYIRGVADRLIRSGLAAYYGGQLRMTGKGKRVLSIFEKL
jgi:hypothetical protein